jgi:AcrR family transcriptional regulator
MGTEMSEGGQATGRRARHRAARHDQLLAAASEIVTESGLEGLTMQGVADRVDCAVGTIYTYFASKSSLTAALQTAAIQTLLGTYHDCAQRWDEDLQGGQVDEGVASLVRVMAFGQLFVAGPELHPREFEFLQMLLTARGRLLSDQDLYSVLPHAMTMVSEAQVLIDAAVACGALDGGGDRSGDDSLNRTLRWIGGLDGAYLVSTVGADRLPDPSAFELRRMSQLLTEDLLLAWGAPRRTLQAATAVMERMRDDGTLLPHGQRR